MPQFNNDAVRRIRDTVRRDEKSIKVKARTVPPKPHGGKGMPAIITGQDGTNPHRYSWEALSPSGDAANSLEPDADLISGTTTDGYAVDAVYQSQHVIIGSTVWLNPAPSNSEYFFYFHYNPHTYSATTTGIANGGSGTVTLDNAETVEVYNSMGHDCPAGEIIIRYQFGEWFIYRPPLAAQDVVTDLQVSGSTLQWKKQNLMVWPISNETDWETWHTGTTCGY